MGARKKLGVGLLIFAAALGCIVVGIFVKIFWNVPGSAENSAIVRRVEAAGAGNVDKHPKLIAPFFDKHIDLAKEIGPDCSLAARHALGGGKDGNPMWKNTTEGLVCMQSEGVVEHGAGYRDQDVERIIGEGSAQ